MARRALIALAGMLLLFLAACAPAATERQEAGGQATPEVRVFRSPS